MQLSISTSTNRITLIGSVVPTYDSAGNMTKDDVQRFVYDGESHLTKLRNITDTADLAEYKLDGTGIRVKKCAPNCTSPTSSTVYIRSGSQVIAEYDNGAAPGSPTREYIYSGSQMVAKIEGGVTTYYHADHLSTRVTSDVNGTKVGEQGTYAFGGTWYSTGLLPKQKFTSYEREAGAVSAGDLDYAVFRYHYPRLGRFTSPDPVAGSIMDPQSLNRYAYSRNDPINLTDPLGLTFDQYCAWYPGDAALCPPLTDKNAGGGSAGTGGWTPQGGAFAWNFLYNPANGFGVIHDFGSWWASITLIGDLGPAWGLLPGNYDAVAEDENGWYADMVRDGLQRLALREAKDRLKEALKNPECAELLGPQADNAQQMLGNMSLVDITAAGFSAPAATADRDVVGKIESGVAVAGTAATPGSPGPGQYGALFARWNGGPFTTYVGAFFKGLSVDARANVLMHELMHLAWKGRGEWGFLMDVRAPGHPWTISNEAIEQKCGLSLPK